MNSETLKKAKELEQQIRIVEDEIKLYDPKKQCRLSSSTRSLWEQRSMFKIICF